MQLSNIPGKLVLPFANAGGKNAIPVDSQIGITAGAASLVDGFPPLTRTPIAAGGVPPSGLDMNGILYELSAIVRWATAGGGYPFDGAFATDADVGGYPKGARIMRADGAGYWFNTTDNNVTDPESAGAAAAGWVPDFTTGVAEVTMTSANITLTPAQYGKPVIVISGALTGDLNLIFPNITGQWAVINNTTGNHAITGKTATGVGVTLQLFDSVVSDGTDVRSYYSTLARSIGSTLVGYLPEGSNSILGTVQKELRGNVFAGSAGAVFDGVTDDTAAINEVILDLATRSPTGGVIKFPSGKLTKINGPLYIPSNIRLDLNGCALVGQGGSVGTMFETAYVSGGALVSNVGTAYQSHVIKNAKIYNGYIYNVGKMCNFQNFNMGCKVQDIELYNALQFGVFDACFYSKFEVVMHSGGTDISLPSFHFKSSNNNIKLTKVVTTCVYDYLFEGGSAAVTLDECSTEGGIIGIKVKGDMLGLNIKGHYAEALMNFLDLSEAGVVKFDVSGNYFNYVDVVLNDGGYTTAGPEISGNWDDTNVIANIGGVVGPTTYRGRMQVSTQQNLARYQIPNNSGFSITSLPANWITSKNTNIEFIATACATSISDYRQKSKVPGTSLVAPYRVGDTGPTYPGFVFFSTVTIGTTSTIDTQIAWQPNSLFSKFAFTAQDGNGNHVIYGDIYGANFKRHDADTMVMTISDNAGFLRISLTQTAAPFVSVTGSVQICS